MNPIIFLNEVFQSEGGLSNDQIQDCFLKYCYLCHKPLSFDKDVYMYRGDVGFCSVGCRSRQMYLDEMRKIEITTRRILASFHRRRRDGGRRCEVGERAGVLPTAAAPLFISK